MQLGNHTSDDDDEHDSVGWLVAPIILGATVYVALSLLVYPFARSVMPLWLIFVALFVPILFPMLLAYVVLVLCILGPVDPPAEERIVVLALPARRARLREPRPPPR